MKLDTLLNQHEGKTLEFKENPSSREKILATVIAFSNTSGGRLIIGVEDQTKIVKGVENPYSEEERLSSFLSDAIAPFLFVSIEIFPWRDTHLIIVDVPMSASRPHYIKSKGIATSCYVRVGSSNRVADILMQESIRRSTIRTAFDEEICTSSKMEDLDTHAIKEAFMPFRSVAENDLITLGIANKNGRYLVPSVGGMLCFGIHKERFFPDAWIQAGCFQGMTKTIILDSLEIRNHFPHCIEEGLNFIRKHLKVGLNIENITHTEHWEIPKIALREALLNAVVHSDYLLAGSPLRIAVYDDRIEIENPGLIPNGLTLEDIKSGLSKVRNRVVARLFRELKQSEQWGSGIGRIIEVCAQHGLKEPVFEETGDRFRVTLFRTSTRLVALDEVAQNILNILRQSGPQSTHEIAGILGYTPRSMRDRLKKLTELGKVTPIAKSAQDPRKKYVLRE